MYSIVLIRRNDGDDDWANSYCTLVDRDHCRFHWAKSKAGHPHSNQSSQSEMKNFHRSFSCSLPLSRHRVFHSQICIPRSPLERHLSRAIVRFVWSFRRDIAVSAEELRRVIEWIWYRHLSIHRIVYCRVSADPREYLAVVVRGINVDCRWRATLEPCNCHEHHHIFSTWKSSYRAPSPIELETDRDLHALSRNYLSLDGLIRSILHTFARTRRKQWIRFLARKTHTDQGESWRDCSF